MLRIVICLLLISSVCPAGEKPKPDKGKPHPLDKFLEPPAPKTFARPNALISVEKLAQLLDKKKTDVVVIDARGQDAYADGHITGARNIESDHLQDPQAPPYFMPGADAIRAICKENGISATTLVVIYDEDDGRFAARVWFTLHAHGHDNVAILEGGGGKWKQAGLAWSNAEVPPPEKQGTFEPAETLRGVCAFKELSQFRQRVHTLGKLPVTSMLDARALAEYMGEDARGKHGGHIPGAAHLEWSAVLTGTEKQRFWRSAPEIHALLRLGGVEKDEKICVYDQAGARSAHLYFTLWLMGFEKAFNYTGGWREYGNRDDVEIEK